MTPEEDAVVVLRCVSCGDTFPTEGHETRRPTSGSDLVEPAHERLL